MITKKHRLTRRRNQGDPALPPTPFAATPSGPAGGDLGGTYPNPTVVGLTHATFPSLLPVSITGSPGDQSVTPAKIVSLFQLVAVSNVAPDPSEARVWMDSVGEVLKIWNGESWLVVATV